MVFDIRLEIKVDVGHVNDNSDDTSNHDIGEDDAQFAYVEAVDADVDEGEGFEEGIVNSYTSDRRFILDRKNQQNQYTTNEIEKTKPTRGRAIMPWRD